MVSFYPIDVQLFLDGYDKLQLFIDLLQLQEDTEWIDVLEKKGIIKKDKPLDVEEAEKNEIEEKNKFKDLDLDEIDEEDERAFLEYRKQRLLEIEQQQSRPRFGSVTEISRQDWVDEVNKAGQDIWVVVHVYQRGDTLSTLINQFLNELAAKFPHTKFIRSLVSLCLPDFPEHNIPAIFVYQNGVLKTQILGSNAFGGTNLKCEYLEWMIAETGSIKTELQKDPRITKFKSRKLVMGVNNDDYDSDSE